jgi:hypothetical protein
MGPASTNRLIPGTGRLSCEAIASAAVGHSPPALPLATLAGYAIVLRLGAAKRFRWE